MDWRFARVMWPTHVSGPSCIVVSITYLCWERPLELLIRRFATNLASQRNAGDAGDLGMVNATHCPPSRSNGSMRTACKDEVAAPLSIFAWTSVIPRSGRLTSSHQPISHGSFSLFLTFGDFTSVISRLCPSFHSGGKQIQLDKKRRSFHSGAHFITVLQSDIKA